VAELYRWGAGGGVWKFAKKRDNEDRLICAAARIPDTIFTRRFLMRTFDRKLVQPRRQARPRLVIHDRQGTVTSNDANPILRLQETIGNRAVQRLISGEMADASIEDEPVAVNAGGDGATTTTQQPEATTTTTTQTTAATLRKSTVSGPTGKNNGEYTWGSRWSLANSNDNTNGWIVQKLVVRQNVTTESASITPGEGGYGGFPASWTPYWEAWKVDKGVIYVGKTTSLHNADTYSQGPVGDKTQGTTQELGLANFYPNITTPNSWTVTNSSPAFALPVTKSDPGLTGGTGSLDHNLTATWNSVTGDGKTTVTTT
jgi:hypothetical protein